MANNLTYSGQLKPIYHEKNNDISNCIATISGIMRKQTTNGTNLTA